MTDLCNHLGRPMESDEQDLFEKGAYDVALGLIENRIGKNRLRPAIRHVLNIQTGADLATHEALLQLATTKEGRLRLVTTNFDQAFALAPRSSNPSVDYAPYLPLPAMSWSSVVHLHGGLGNPRDPDGHSLIVTSADFTWAFIAPRSGAPGLSA